MAQNAWDPRPYVACTGDGFEVTLWYWIAGAFDHAYVDSGQSQHECSTCGQPPEFHDGRCDLLVRNVSILNLTPDFHRFHLGDAHTQDEAAWTATDQYLGTHNTNFPPGYDADVLCPRPTDATGAGGLYMTEDERPFRYACA